MSTLNVNKERTVARSLPYTVTYSVEGTVKRKRFKEPNAAWLFLSEVKGTLCFGFRVLGEA
jgi:hypothetical protein